MPNKSITEKGILHNKASDACEALFDALVDRDEALPTSKRFDYSGAGAPVWAAALMDAGWSLTDAEPHAPLVVWESDRDRDHLESAAAKIRRPWEVLEELAEQPAREARRALRAAAPTPAAEDDAWTATDLDALDLDAPVSYVSGSLAERVVYSTGLTTLAGEGDVFKSTLGQALALDALRAGQRVVHVDYEQGAALTFRKYKRLGATETELRDLASGHFWQPGAITPARLAALVDGHGALVLVDSFAKAASAAGLGSVDWAAHGELLYALNAFGVEHEVAVVLIDHQAGDKYALGAKAKFHAASAQWRVQVPAGKRPDENTRGEITLTKVKFGREGGLDTHARYAVGGDGSDKISVRRLAQGDSTPLARDLAIIGYLREAGEFLPLTEIAKGVGGRRQEVAQATRRLASDPNAPIIERDGRFGVAGDAGGADDAGVQ